MSSSSKSISLLFLVVCILPSCERNAMRPAERPPLDQKELQATLTSYELGCGTMIEDTPGGNIVYSLATFRKKDDDLIILRKWVGDHFDVVDTIHPGAIIRGHSLGCSFYKMDDRNFAAEYDYDTSLKIFQMWEVDRKNGRLIRSYDTTGAYSENYGSEPEE
jgi:hypothetical protein